MSKEFFIESPGHNVDAGAKVAECFWEVHHADGDRDDRSSWIASLDRQKVSNYFHNRVPASNMSTRFADSNPE